MEWIDRSVLEAASWRLGSELTRRHPDTARLIRAHPGGGQYDCLWLIPTAGDKGNVQLNRNGTIQVLERFDGRPADDFEPVEWDEYLRADPRDFLDRLETAAGLPLPQQIPAATHATLTYRILAAIASTAVKSVHPIEIQLGFIDSSGTTLARTRRSLRSLPSRPSSFFHATTTCSARLATGSGSYCETASPCSPSSSERGWLGRHTMTSASI